MGIVGLPNVGKSTLFNALLKKQQALAANYPFATIEPNVGVVAIPDKRLATLAQTVASERMHVGSEGKSKESLTHVNLPPEVPATVEFVDIAGIVAGAHKGEGLGNKFLTHIREVSLIAHVVRDFNDPDVVRTGKSMEEDYQTVLSELILKDLETVERKMLAAKHELRTNTGLAQLLNKLVTGFNEGKRAAEILRTDETLEVADLFLLTMKPQVAVVNVAENELREKASESNRVSYAQRLGIDMGDVVVISAKIESELAVLNDSDAKMYLGELGITESGLEQLAKTAYSKLGLMSFLTAGEKEVRAWTITRGTKAPAAAGVIHSDFEDLFIKAEVVKFDEFTINGGWKKCRELGKVRVEGRDYVMAEGDVVEFKIGSR